MPDKCPAGFPAHAAAWKLAAALDQPHSESAWEEGGSCADLQEHLARHHLGGRVVLASEEELGRLPLPTLVQLKDGSWMLLHARIGSLWELETPEGRRHGSLGEFDRTGMVLERLPGLPPSGSLWKRLTQLILEHRSAMGQIALVTLAMQGLALIVPLTTRLVVDQALPEASRSLLALAVLGTLLAFLTSAALGLMRDWTCTYVETRLEAIARSGLLDHVLHLPFRDLLGRTVGELLQAFSAVSLAKNLLGQRLFSVALDALSAGLYLLILAGLWPLGALLTLLACLLLAALATLGGLLQAHFQRKALPAMIKERDLFAEILCGIATLKSAGAERLYFERWSERYGRMQRLNLTRDRAGLLHETGAEGTRQLLTLLLLIEGGRRMLSGELTPGTFLAFVQLSGLVLTACQGAANLVSSFSLLYPQINKAQEILTLEPEARPDVVSTPVKLDLEVENLWFRYAPGDPWVLKDFSMRAECGSRHWLRWASGAGKSTFLRILAGLLEPAKGQVRFGGRAPKDLRDQIIYMPQGCQVYGASILENLQIMSGRAPLERIQAASETSGLARLVETLPMGYETLLAQGGLNLSGGQRQLILLTAAMATERRILLLDEAFSNLDWLSRSEILQSGWFEGKTVLYASHDAGLPQERP